MLDQQIDNGFLTGTERFFDDDEIIVSKTNSQGHLTYANRIFLRMASMTEAETIGQPHSVIRHPHMPRCIFKLLWDTISAGNELFAFVVNRAKNGDHYWVNAHVTPTFDANGQIIGYHSNRRTPNRPALDNTIIPLYDALLKKEQSHSDRKEGLEASFSMVLDLLKEKNVSYDEFIASMM